MKRYISSLLIPCLLLHLFGCYSYNAITMDELKQYPGENNIKIITDSTEIIINRVTNNYEKNNWNSTDSSILISKNNLSNNIDTTFIEAKTLEVPFYKICRTEIRELDYIKTTIFCVTLATVLIFALAGLYVSQGGLNIGLHGNL